MARRKGGPAPAVLGTVVIMVFVYYSTVFVFLDHWVGLATPAGAAHAAAVSLAVAACFLAFVCAAGADPGAVPPAFAPDAEAAQGQGLKSRYCDKCCMFKPPRTHHCKVCRRCVLKMKMPSIQLWSDSQKQAEVIGGGHKSWLVIDDVRRMVEQEE